MSGQCVDFLPLSMCMAHFPKLLDRRWGRLACTGGWWFTGGRRHWWSVNKLCMCTEARRRTGLLSGTRVWHLGAPSSRKALPAQPSSSRKSLLRLRALENLQIISGQRRGGLTAWGSDSQGPLTGSGPGSTAFSCPLQRPRPRKCKPSGAVALL